MHLFLSDYLEGAYPAILERLLQTNLEQTAGYGTDPYSDSAREKIKCACRRDDIDVHFLLGGTQANLTVIAAILRPHQGVLAAESGHINGHETGAVEASGHKILTLPAEEGKISAKQIDDYCRAHFTSDTREHLVQPGLVYLSQPTELGTLYTKNELLALRETCDRWHLPLFIDGARLAYALAAPANDVALPDLCQVADVFYIGGTKCGALFGEAVVIVADALKQDFRYHMKQRGGLLAKGRLLGLQFEVLFSNGLYQKGCTRAVEQALQIRDAFAQKGVSFYVDAPANQQFPVLHHAQLDHLSQRHLWTEWMPLDDTHRVVRFYTSWATNEEQVAALIEDIATMPSQ